MAVDMFLKLDGIDGEATDDQHLGWIEVSSFSWGVSNSTAVSSTGGAGAGKASFQDLHFEQLFDKSSAQVALYCAAGKHIANATLSVRKSGADPTGKQGIDFLKVNLVDVLVSSFEVAAAEGGDDRPTESVSLNFVKIEFQYQPPSSNLIDVILDVAE
jgi:type VI secretion system secreted protein Hcp